MCVCRDVLSVCIYVSVSMYVCVYVCVSAGESPSALLVTNGNGVVEDRSSCGGGCGSIGSSSSGGGGSDGGSCGYCV